MAPFATGRGCTAVVIASLAAFAALPAAAQRPAAAGPERAIHVTGLEPHGWSTGAGPAPTAEVFVRAPGRVPAGAHPGALRLGADAGAAALVHAGEHGPASQLGADLRIHYTWMGSGAPRVRLALGIRTAEADRVARSGRDAGPLFDKLLVLEPAAPADGTWHTEQASASEGSWWIEDRVERASSRSAPRALAELARAPLPIGTRTSAELWGLITAPGAVIASVALEAEPAGRGDAYVSELTASLLFHGARTTFGALAGVTNTDTAEAFTTIQAAIDDPDTLDGHTLVVASGTYPESVLLPKRLTLRGAQAGTSAVGRVVGAPSPALESIVAPPSGSALTLATGSADSVVDGFVLLGGTHGIESISGPLDALELRGNHVAGQSGSNVWLRHDAVNATIDGNVLLSTAAMGDSLRLDATDCDGLYLTGNVLSRSGGQTADGLSASGNNNLGASGLRGPLIAQNVVAGHATGIDLGSRAFVGGELLQNQVRGNSTGLGYGIQGALIAGNVFAGNGRAIAFSALGSASPLHGAFGCTVSGNQILASSVSGIELDALQAAGTIGTNAFDSNCFGGNAQALAYAGLETVQAEDNWWGHASGPLDPFGTNPAGNPPCPAVPLINAGGLGELLTGDALDYCPWLAAPVCQSLVLLAADCQDDASPAEGGTQVEVELWMLDLGSPATGFQAFLEYDAGVMSYRGDLSAYSALPFPLHIQGALTAEVLPGKLRLDGSDLFGAGGTAADALLATLVFDVDLECATTAVAFDLTQPFESTVSVAGYPLPTSLTDSPGFTLDDSAPVFDPYADVSVAADAGSTGGCAGAVVAYPPPSFSEGCPGGVLLDCSPPSGSFFPTGTTGVTCTAADACGNEALLTFDVTVTPTNLIDVEVDLVGVTLPAARCIRFALDDCGTSADAVLAFSAGSPSSALATLEVPCGDYAAICAKDQQHTLWATSALVLSGDGSRYEASSALLLDGGDTDDDGDVDIDDVTWFLAQFGSLASAGGCPWDGTRDADFSLNTAVASEDYTFLVANWLATSSCGSCPLAAGPAGMVRRAQPAAPRTSAVAEGQLGRRADLDGDGLVDHRDVALFEDARGLPRDLSSRMRASQTR